MLRCDPIHDQKDPVSGVNNVVLYEAEFTQKPLSNKAAFFW